MTAGDRSRLLALARSALEARVRGAPVPALPSEPAGTASGLFVTVRCDGHLRGCLGAIADDLDLLDAVSRLAADVATEDFRFARLLPAELPRVVIEVSVLSPAEIVADPSQIVVGRDGLIVEQGRSRGLLLPQVPIEHGWDRETFLEQTCVKAGLPSSAWRHGATIRRFQAQVFHE